MARPKKEGLDYFPLDVDIDQDDKIALIEAKHGLEGFAVVIKLLMKIYKNSYFYNWTENEQLLFSKRINVNINSLNDIINDCLKWDLFSKCVFDRYQVLTSIGIQRRYLEAIIRRKDVVLNKDYLLIEPETYLKAEKTAITYINANNYGINVDINSKNADINPQSKVKESKEKKSKEDIFLQISNLRERYSLEQLKAIDDYFDMIRHTRRSGTISDSVKLKIYQEWDKHPDICVEYGVKVHTDNVQYHSRKENYTLGIIRNTTAEEAANKLTDSQKNNQRKRKLTREEKMDAARDREIAFNRWVSDGNDPENFDYDQYNL